MGKKAHVVSLSLNDETHERLRIIAQERTEGNVSKLMRDTIDRYLLYDEDIVPVILKIPANLKGKEEDLKQWLQAKSTAIVKALGL